MTGPGGNSEFCFSKTLVIGVFRLLFYCKFKSPACKEVVSDSPGLVDYAIGLVNSVLNLPDGQAKIFWRIKITKLLQDKCFKFLINSCGPKVAPTKHL